MKEAILNAMNPIEKKILEKEVQKIHIPEEPIPFDDFGKKIRYVKKIRELLDQDAELEEIKALKVVKTRAQRLQEYRKKLSQLTFLDKAVA